MSEQAGRPEGDLVEVPALRRWIERFASDIAEHHPQLTDLDAAIGDADHGSNMNRGMAAVVAALDAAPPDAGGLLKKAGMTLVSTVGGASGPLYGTLFLRMATAAGDTSTLDGPALASMFRAGLDGVVARGKAQVGDKTMVDALAPAVEALEKAVAGGQPVAQALRAAADAGQAGRDATIPLQARKGRASYLGERSVGHQDPGATSMAMLLTAAAEALPGSSG